MTNITELELRAMNYYAFDEMNPTNGARPSCADDVACYVWLDEMAAGLNISQAQAKGVLGSLVAKGLAYVIEEDNPEDNGFGFTAEGFAAWKMEEERRNGA